MFEIIEDRGVTLLIKCIECGLEKVIHTMAKKKMLKYPCDCKTNTRIGAKHGPYILEEINIQAAGGRVHKGVCENCKAVKLIRQFEITHNKVKKCYKCQRKQYVRDPNKKPNIEPPQNKAEMSKHLDNWYASISRTIS